MIKALEGKGPRIAQPSFVAESAAVIGDVQTGERCSIWYGAVIRADINAVRIGRCVSVQENAVIHVDKDPTVIGDEVTIGHGATLHGCTVGNRALIGIGAIVLDGAEIGDECVIGAGAVVAPGTKVPPRSMVLGVPGRVVRTIGDSEASGLRSHALEYWELASRYVG